MTYAGNKVFNSNNLFAILILLFGGVLSIYKPGNFPFFIPLCMAIFITAGQAFYFELTTDQLVIRNYMIPFLNFRYQLKEITQVQFLETNSKSTSKARVKIIRGDKRSIPVNAASLGINDWQLFINELSAKKIPVDIQAISLKNSIGVPE